MLTGCNSWSDAHFTPFLTKSDHLQLFAPMVMILQPQQALLGAQGSMFGIWENSQALNHFYYVMLWLRVV